MSYLYKRTEKDNKVVIVLNSYPIFQIAIIISFILTFALFSKTAISVIFAIIGIALMYIRVIAYIKPYKEIKNAMKNSEVKISGSKWSIKNPIRYIIEK